jgi:hypothetical protein
MAAIDKHRWAVLSPLLEEMLDADDDVRTLRLSLLKDTDSDQASVLTSLMRVNSSSLAASSPALVGRDVNSNSPPRFCACRSRT